MLYAVTAGTFVKATAVSTAIIAAKQLLLLLPPSQKLFLVAVTACCNGADAIAKATAFLQPSSLLDDCCLFDKQI